MKAAPGRRLWKSASLVNATIYAVTCLDRIPVLAELKLESVGLCSKPRKPGGYYAQSRHLQQLRQPFT